MTTLAVSAPIIVPVSNPASLPALLDTLDGMGITWSVRDGGIALRPAKCLTPEMKAAVLHHKAALIALHKRQEAERKQEAVTEAVLSCPTWASALACWLDAHGIKNGAVVPLSLMQEFGALRPAWEARHGDARLPCFVPVAALARAVGQVKTYGPCRFTSPSSGSATSPGSSPHRRLSA